MGKNNEVQRNDATLLSLYARKTDNISPKHTFVQALATVDYNYNGCFNADDDPADYAPIVLKGVRVG